MNSVTFGTETLSIVINSGDTPIVLHRQQVTKFYGTFISTPPNEPNNELPTPPTQLPTNYFVVLMYQEGQENFPMGHVTNQAGWVNTLAGQAQCVTDLTAWLNA